MIGDIEDLVTHGIYKIMQETNQIIDPLLVVDGFTKYELFFGVARVSAKSGGCQILKN